MLQTTLRSQFQWKKRLDLPGILQLERFFLVKMNLEFITPEEPVAKEKVVGTEHDFGVNYTVKRKADDSTRYLMSLMLDIHPKTFGWRVEAKLDGFFRCPEDLPEPKREGLVRVNGGTILYGILRGQLSAMTGSFPPGPIILPTVNMREIVVAKEKSAGNTVIENVSEEDPSAGE